ncbi:hypothetical protein [Caballeronia sp. SBC2]|uniref:hypothetical protein n=1 Tax=Caballeronia sp. SBC2 TaxID=2705547 RepID=UPI0013EB5356|nr:hypothetical protein [Caballeronia sp. SBC2]
MKQLLIHSAKQLKVEDAGGHGDRWSVVQDDVPALINSWIGTAIQEGEIPPFALTDERALEELIARGESSASALLYTGSSPGASKTGLMSLIHHDAPRPDQKSESQLWSAFPFFGIGLEIEAEVEDLWLFPNRIEARLELRLWRGGLIEAFDSMFCQHRALYRQGESYRFSLSALAYQMKPALPLEKVIDDEREIRRFRARELWVKTHGCYGKGDEDAALAAWKPSSIGDLEPIRISLDEMVTLLPASSGPSDDAQYRGQVVRVVPRAVRMLDVHFWQIDCVVMRDVEDLILPIYVAERLLGENWRPEVGQYVEGSLWMQAYVVGHATRAV